MRGGGRDGIDQRLTAEDKTYHVSLSHSKVRFEGLCTRREHSECEGYVGTRLS